MPLDLTVFDEGIFDAWADYTWALPSPPTNVEATVREYDDKVVITWTQDPNSISYQVYRDGVGLGWVGDVATYDDEGAGDDPTIIPGTAIASDGEFKDYVALSLTGHYCRGNLHTYKVRGRNAYGIESPDSDTDIGCINIGGLTYQWQRSFGDSDEFYSIIEDADTATYSDTGAPERGWGRYYRCVLNSEGAAQQISASERGYRLAPVIQLLGATRIDALDYMAQLGDESVIDYTASEKAVNTIVGELLALQYNTPAVTAGTIEYTDALSIDVPQDTILGVLLRLREVLGGYMYVDNNRALQWKTDIGSDTGQQIRYKKNLKSIRRTVDYSNFANRIYVYGAGEGESRIKISDQVFQGALVPGNDIARKSYHFNTSTWTFSLAPSEWRVGCWDTRPSSSDYAYGAGGRFLNVTIPQGSIITAAYLKFPNGSGMQEEVNSVLHGEDADDAAAFSTLVNYDARPRTTAAVSWSPIPPWSGSTERVSPDIKDIIQEIVDRGSWVSGNAMVIFWDDHGGASDYVLYHYRDGELPPTLYVEYEEEGTEYIEDAVSQAEYGGIYTKTLINRAITDAGTLFQWATLKLLEMKDPYISYEIDMANLEAVGLSFEALALGNTVRVIDEDLDINVTARVVKITRDLSNPVNIKVEIANKSKDIIDQLGRDFRWRNENY